MNLDVSANIRTTPVSGRDALNCPSRKPPSHAPTTHERFFRVTLLSLLIASALATGLAALAHHWQPNPGTLNRWLPGLLCVAYVVLSVILWRWPDKLITIVWAAFVTGLVGIATPAWVFSLQAWQPGAAP